MKTPCRNPARSAAVFLAFASVANSQIETETGPVGYESLTVHANTFSLLATRVHRTTLVAGLIDTVTGTQVTDNQIDFGPLLDPAKRHVLELRGTPSAHRVIDIVSISGSTLTLAEPGVVVAGDLYSVRALFRLSEIFNPVLVPEFTPVEDFNPDSGDLILIPDGTGRFKQYYYSSRVGHVGFFNAGTGAAEDPFIRYTEALLYRRHGATFHTVVSGEVKVSATAIPLTRRFNPIGSVTYTESLTDLGLAATLQPGTAESADLVWSQNIVTGEMNRYFYSDGSAPGLTAGWRKVDPAPGAENNDQSAVAVSTGVVIRRRGPLPHTVILQTPPGL